MCLRVILNTAVVNEYVNQTSFWQHQTIRGNQAYTVDNGANSVDVWKRR